MDGKTLERLVQIGTVSSVDAGAKKARVFFSGTQITSDWLPVLQRTGEVVSVTAAGGHSHSISCPGGEGSPSAASVADHTHTASVTVWMPTVGQTVVVLYLPIFNSDGFILGGI